MSSDVPLAPASLLEAYAHWLWQTPIPWPWTVTKQTAAAHMMDNLTEDS